MKIINYILIINLLFNNFANIAYSKSNTTTKKEKATVVILLALIATAGIYTIKKINTVAKGKEKDFDNNLISQAKKEASKQGYTESETKEVTNQLEKAKIDRNEINDLIKATETLQESSSVKDLTNFFNSVANVKSVLPNKNDRNEAINEILSDPALYKSATGKDYSAGNIETLKNDLYDRGILSRPETQESTSTPEQASTPISEEPELDLPALTSQQQMAQKLAEEATTVSSSKAKTPISPEDKPEQSSQWQSESATPEQESFEYEGFEV